MASLETLYLKLQKLIAVVFLANDFNLRVVREDSASKLCIVKSLDKLDGFILGLNVVITF